MRKLVSGDKSGVGGALTIQKLLQRQFQREDWTLPGAADQGWSAVEDTVKLSG